MKVFFQNKVEKEKIARKSNKSSIRTRYERCNKTISRKSYNQDSRTRSISRIFSLDDIVNNIKNAETLKETIYFLEPLAYYLVLKPSEFWNSRYREMYIF